MTQQNLDFGTSTPGDGDRLASAFLKVHENFTDLYGRTSGVINVKHPDFGATGDGTTNDTAAVQAAFDAAAANSTNGCTVYFPAGYYICSGGLTYNSSQSLEIRGDGFQNTFIETGAATNVKLLSLAGGRHAVRNICLVGAGGQGTYTPTLAPGSVSSTSHALHITSTCVDVLIEHCYIIGGYYGVLNEGADTLIADCVITQSFGTALVENKGAGLFMRRDKCDTTWPTTVGGASMFPAFGVTAGARANTTAYIVGDIVSTQNFYVQCRVAGTSGGSAPALLGYGQNITDGTVTWRLLGRTTNTSLTIDTGATECHVTQCDFTGCFGRASVYIANLDAGTAPTLSIFSDNVISQSIGTCFDVVAGSGLLLSGNEISGGRLTGTGALQMRTAWLGDATILNNTLYSGGNGLYIGSGSYHSVVGNTFGGFSAEAIAVEANISDFVLSCNVVGAMAGKGTNNNGIVVAAGTSDYYAIVDNVTRGCTGTAITDGGTGTTGTQLTIKTTTGNGTTDAIAIVGGNNGATAFGTVNATKWDVPQTTDATSAATGAMTIAGGLGVAKQFYALGLTAVGSTSAFQVTRRDNNASVYSIYSTAGNFQLYSNTAADDILTFTGAGAMTLPGTFAQGSNATDRAAIKGFYMTPANVAVAVPSIANDAAENVDEVAVDVSAAFSMAPAVGDAVIAIPQEALPTDCVLCGAWVSATDTITVSFASKEGGGGVSGANKNFKFLVFDLT